MYRYSPVRNPRSKGIKFKHVVQVCLLIAVCFWLIFQVKRSHDKKKEFDAKISLNTRADETIKFGRKDLKPKLDETTAGIQTLEDTQEQEDDEENKHEEEEQDEDKIEDGGGGGDDEIDENEQEKSNMEIDRDEVDIIDEDKETVEGDGEGQENEEKDGETETETETETENRVEDGSTQHTNEAREEHYKADDASSAVITGNPENETKNVTLDDNSSEDVGSVDNHTVEENDSSDENGPPPKTTTPSSGYQVDSNTTVTEITLNLSTKTGMLKSNGEEDESRNDNFETNEEDPTHLEVQNDLQTVPEIETDSASE